jgi:hypothetical protein
VGNHDFEDLTLAMDEEAWCEALRTAYSFRALNELVLMGQITVPFRLVNSRDFVPRSLYEGGEQGLALARHLEGRGPDVDILCRGEPFILLMTHITYAPTVQYLLRRLLDVADVSFDVRKQQCLSGAPGYAQVFLGASPSPLQLLVYQFYRQTFVTSGERLFARWSSLPWFEELRILCPDATFLILHVDLLHMMGDITYVHVHTIDSRPLHIRDVLVDSRPPVKLTCAWNAGSFSFTYGLYTRQSTCSCHSSGGGMIHPLLPNNLSRLVYIVQGHYDSTQHTTLLDSWIQKKKKKNIKISASSA